MVCDQNRMVELVAFKNLESVNTILFQIPRFYIGKEVKDK